MSYIAENLWLVWTIIAVICLVVEMSSGDFFVTCFAVGALFGVAAALVDAPFWVQVLAFAVFSVLSLRLLRPRLVKLLRRNADKRVSNADALIGRIGEVSETIKAEGYGRVKIDGDDWKAETDGEEDIATGEKVMVTGRESIIIRVRRA